MAKKIFQYSYEQLESGAIVVPCICGKELKNGDFVYNGAGNYHCSAVCLDRRREEQEANTPDIFVALFQSDRHAPKVELFDSLELAIKAAKAAAFDGYWDNETIKETRASKDFEYFIEDGESESVTITKQKVRTQ